MALIHQFVSANNGYTASLENVLKLSKVKLGIYSFKVERVEFHKFAVNSETQKKVCGLFGIKQTERCRSSSLSSLLYLFLLLKPNLTVQTGTR